MKKILTLCLSTLLLCGTLVSPANASTSSNNTTKFKLDDVYITVPYNPNKIDITYKKTNNEVEATITDKATHKCITSIGQVKDSNDKALLKSSGDYIKTVYSEVKAGPTKSRLYAVLNCYNYNNFRQINSIKKTYWSEASSGNWKLERENSDGYIADPTSAGVGTKATITGTANVVVTTTSTTKGSFSISALEGVGFSIENSEGSTYYGRYPIESEYTATLY